MVSLPESWGDECALICSIIGTLGKEGLDLLLDGRWTTTDVMYGLMGAVAGYAIRKIRHM